MGEIIKKIEKAVKSALKPENKKKYIKITACILFLAAAVVFTVISIGLSPSDDTRQWYQIIASVCIACALMCVFGEDGARGLKKAVQGVKDFFQSFAEKIIQRIASIFGMRLGKGYRGASLIRDYKETSFKVKKNTAMQKKIRKRYKDMNSPERIRYFYGKLINAQIRKGFPFQYSLTASEIGKQLIEKEKISQSSKILFETYNEARYNAKADITEEDVEKIKKIYKNP